ncbi:MAG: hypothetical protein ACK5KL_05230 [Dysgonomonas sp.]
MREPYKNKQAILDRIRRFAASHYGLGRIESLDPVSGLFLESLSEEIYNLSGDIERMESRILDKLSSMLVSGNGYDAFPSHTILHATSASSSLAITTKTPFTGERNYNGKLNRLSFYPVCNTHIYQGDVKYFVHKGQFYSTEIYGTKTLLTRSRYKDSFPERTFWIGIEFDDTITEVDNLSFYLNLSGSYDKEVSLNEFTHAEWKVGKQELPIQRGLAVIEDEQENEILKFYSTFDNSNVINDRIKRLYDSHYLSIKGNLSITDKKEILPDCLADKFDAVLSENIQKPLLWVSVSCRESLLADVLDSLQVSINTFPIACKKLVKQTQEVNNVVSIIPLRTGANESFLSISSLTDSLGQKYYDIPVKDTEDNNYHIYSLRHGGCERYNDRDAIEYLHNAIRKLDSEASSFFRNRKDTKNELKQIRSDVNKVLKDLKETIAGIKDNYEIENYLLIDRDKDTEIYFLEYWLINYKIANGIKAGTVFRSDLGNLILPASLISLIPVTGGRAAAEPNLKYGYYKKSLTNSSLIVTEDDIIRFCKKEYPEVIKSIKIKQGHEEDPDRKNGFLRTTDIYIQPTNIGVKVQKDMDELSLRELLHKHSPATFRYRIFIT